MIAVLVKEEKAFRQTLRKGIKQLRAYADDGITGAELFTLYDTFGFPVELSTEEARRQGIAAQPAVARGVRREDGRAAGPLAAGQQDEDLTARTALPDRPGAATVTICRC